MDLKSAVFKPTQPHEAGLMQCTALVQLSQTLCTRILQGFALMASACSIWARYHPRLCSSQPAARRPIRGRQNAGGPIPYVCDQLGPNAEPKCRSWVMVQAGLGPVPVKAHMICRAFPAPCTCLRGR